jgi:hypothetical protein
MGFKIFQVFVLATLKYFLTIPYAAVIGIEYKYALPTIVIGGMAGFLFFYYLSHKTRSQSMKLLRIACTPVSDSYKTRCRRFFTFWLTKKEKHIFTRRNRMIVRLKNNYGLWGIVITTPVLLSIPVGAFLASHYFPRNKRMVLYMLASIFAWGILLSSILLLLTGTKD